MLKEEEDGEGKGEDLEAPVCCTGKRKAFCVQESNDLQSNDLVNLSL